MNKRQKKAHLNHINDQEKARKDKLRKESIAREKARIAAIQAKDDAVKANEEAIRIQKAMIEEATLLSNVSFLAGIERGAGDW